MANPETQPEIARAIPIPLMIIEEEKPPEIGIPDFAALRKGHQSDAANFQRDNAALIAAGKIPALNLNIEGKADSTTTRTLKDGRKVSLAFDEHSHLSKVEVISPNGDMDVASVKNGRVNKETVKAKGAEVIYRFDANNQITQETINAPGAVSALDLKDGKVIHARGESLKQGIADDFTDQPNDHTYRVAQPDGQNLKFEYDENGSFQFGTDYQRAKGENSADKTWLISPNGHGGLNVVRGQEV